MSSSALVQTAPALASLEQLALGATLKLQQRTSPVDASRAAVVRRLFDSDEHDDDDNANGEKGDDSAANEQHWPSNATSMLDELKATSELLCTELRAAGVGAICKDAACFVCLFDCLYLFFVFVFAITRNTTTYSNASER